MQFIFFQVLLKRIKAIKFFLKDKLIPKRKKAIIVAGIIYLLLPFDLIPPILFPIAWMDDVLLWIFIIWYLKDELDKYWLGTDEVKPSEKYKGKTIIDDVNYEVKEKDDEQ